LRKIRVLAITTIAKKKSFLARFYLILHSKSSHLGRRVEAAATEYFFNVAAFISD
jgi:hypothetical protein